MKKVVVFGNQQIALDCVSYLRKDTKVNLVSVVGCESAKDKEVGYPSLRNHCRKMDVLFYNPPKLDSNFFKLFKSWKPDLCFSIYYRNIFKNNYLSAPPMGFINIHPSLLPKYRGPVPVLWAVFNNEARIGVTLHYIDKGIDSGDIITQASIKVPKNATGHELNSLVSKKGFELFKRQFPLILAGKNKREKQDHSQATYYGPFKSELAEINWFLPTAQVVKRIKMFTKPYKGASASLFSKRMLIWSAKVVNLSKKRLTGPGKIIKVNKDRSFVVSGIDGYVLVDDYEVLERKTNVNKIIKSGNRFDLF